MTSPGFHLAFASHPSPEGKDLADRVRHLASSLGATFEEVPSIGRDRLGELMTDGSLVVIDASLPDVHTHNYVGLYPNLHQKNIVIVSRTFVPENFTSLYPGGWPVYPGRWSNDDLERFLRETVTRLLPRLGPRRRHSGVGALLRRSALVRSVDFAVQFARQNASRQLLERYGDEGEVFISFRSTALADVRRLQREIQAGRYHGGRPVGCRVLAAAEYALEGEVLTHQRMWQIIASTDRHMIAAREVWIYWTDDYPRSWWTTGEVLALAYRAMHPSFVKRFPRLFLYFPRTDERREIPWEALPTLSKAEDRRLSRWYTHSDPVSMSPTRRLVLPEVFQRIPGAVARYAEDPVFDEAFWSTYRLRNHPAPAGGPPIPPEEALRGMSPDFFLHQAVANTHPFSAAQLDEAVRGGGWLRWETPEGRFRAFVEARPPRYFFFEKFCRRVEALQQSARAAGADPGEVREMAAMVLGPHPVFVCREGAVRVQA